MYKTRCIAWVLRCVSSSSVCFQIHIWSSSSNPYFFCRKSSNFFETLNSTTIWITIWQSSFQWILWSPLSISPISTWCNNAWYEWFFHKASETQLQNENRKRCEFFHLSRLKVFIWATIIVPFGKKLLNVASKKLAFAESVEIDKAILFYSIIPKKKLKTKCSSRTSNKTQLFMTNSSLNQTQ